MILEISDKGFKRIFENKEFSLPARWDGRDFSQTLANLYHAYLTEVRREFCLLIKNNYKSKRCRSCVSADYCYNCDSCQDYTACQFSQIAQVCNSIVEVVNHYLNGFPAKAYSQFAEIMQILKKYPLEIYQKSVFEQFIDRRPEDLLHLYRAVNVVDNEPYKRERVFHVPYNLRSKVSSSRYSIAGYPSLYLATTLDLCCEEIDMPVSSTKTIAARFQIDRNYQRNKINIQVIELALKPQDFLMEEQNNNLPRQHRRSFYGDLIRSPKIRAAYLLWYPLIAACSFIRINKKDPFAAEYIIPQLLMQWLRNATENTENYSEMLGIRYFSCSSSKASDMGFNYVFPTSGCQHADYPFCQVLLQSFFLTEPVYICDYHDLYACERALNNETALQKITGEKY